MRRDAKFLPYVVVAFVLTVVALWYYGIIPYTERCEVEGKIVLCQYNMNGTVTVLPRGGD